VNLSVSERRRPRPAPAFARSISPRRPRRAPRPVRSGAFQPSRGTRAPPYSNRTFQTQAWRRCPSHRAPAGGPARPEDGRGNGTRRDSTPGTPRRGGPPPAARAFIGLNLPRRYLTVGVGEDPCPAAAVHEPCGGRSRRAGAADTDPVAPVLWLGRGHRNALTRAGGVRWARGGRRNVPPLPRVRDRLDPHRGPAGPRGDRRGLGGWGGIHLGRPRWGGGRGRVRGPSRTRRPTQPSPPWASSSCCSSASRCSPSGTCAR